MKKLKILLLLVLIIAFMSLLMGCTFDIIDEQQNNSGEAEVIPTAKAEPTYDNNGNLFVEYNGDIYFREYTGTSKEPSAIWANYFYADNETKKFKRLLNDGTVEELFDDKGYGKFYIIDDMIFGYDELGLYYIDLNGKNQMPIGNGVKYLKADEKNHRLYYSDNYDNGEIFYIDTLTLETKDFCNQKIETFIDLNDEFIYYFQSSEDKKNEINVMKYNVLTNESSIVASLADGRVLEEIEDDGFISSCQTEDFIVSDNKLYVVVGIREGSGGFFSAGMLYEVDLLNETRTLLKSDVDSSIVLNGNKLYFSDLVYEYDDDNYYHSIDINTKEISEEDPMCEYDKAKDGMMVSITPDSQLILTKKDDVKIIIYSDEDKLSTEEKYLSEYEEDERLVEVINVNILPKYIIYEVQVSVTNPEADIGWRTGYSHIASEIHYFDIEKEEDTLLYSYEVNE